MFYREYPPPAELLPYIQCFWALEHDYRDSFHTHEHLWADTQTELIFSYGAPYYRQIDGVRMDLPANVVIGPFRKELLLYSDGLTGFVAVRFHPWGFANFTEMKMTGLINAIVPAEIALGECPWMPGQPVTGQVETHLEILKNWLCRRLAEKPGNGKPVKGTLAKESPVPAIAAKIKANKGIVKIAALAAAFRLHPRTLERLFITETGMSAKLLARILRFNHAKKLIENDPEISLASLTYETGYADQAHFSHNFREMFGYSPAEFRTLVRQWNEKMAGERPDVVFLQDKP